MKLEACDPFSHSAPCTLQSLPILTQDLNYRLHLCFLCLVIAAHPSVCEQYLVRRVSIGCVYLRECTPKAFNSGE